MKAKAAGSQSAAVSDSLRQDVLVARPESVPYGQGQTRIPNDDSRSVTDASGSTLPSNSSQSEVGPSSSLPDKAKSPAMLEREANERVQFQKLYQQRNFELDPMQNGWGPFQSLQQMGKEQKINLTPDEILTESRRIRDRDFETLDRKFYLSSDHVMRWTDNEIEQKVQQTVNKVKGIDVSSYQSKIDWKQVKDAGYEFAFLKASEGVDWVDPTFAANRSAARDAGLAVGYYHYFRPNDAVDAQVKNFVSTVGKAEPNSLRLVIDAEDPSMWNPYTVQQRAQMIQDWCSGVQKALGVTPQISIYASPSFVNQILQNAPGLSKYSLWIANYNVAEPNVPKPWSTWDFWQYSDSGNVPGISAGGGVDLDMYSGTSLNASAKAKRR